MKNKLSKILQSFENIEFALLFGSYAKGCESYLSDIDIAIYTKKQIDIFTQGEILAQLESQFDKRIDLVVLNELFKSNAKLSFNIVDNHNLLFCKNKEKYVEFKTNSLKYFFDMKYMYDMFDDSLKQRLNDGTYGKTKAS